MAHVMFGNVEVDVDRVNRLKRNDRIAGGEVFSEIDLANTKHAGERRTNGFAVDVRLTSSTLASVALWSAIALS